jgi:hypothetical protein
MKTCRRVISESPMVHADIVDRDDNTSKVLIIMIAGSIIVFIQVYHTYGMVQSSDLFISDTFCYDVINMVALTLILLQIQYWNFKMVEQSTSSIAFPIGFVFAWNKQSNAVTTASNASATQQGYAANTSRNISFVKFRINHSNSATTIPCHGKDGMKA